MIHALSKRPSLFLLSFIIFVASLHIPNMAFSSGKKGAPPLTLLGTYRDISSVKKRPLSAVLAAKQKEIKRRVSARSTIVMDAKNGEVLFARDPDKQRQPASTIKVLTGIIAIKSLKIDAQVSVSRKAANMPSSKIYLDPRRQYRAGDLIDASLLASANDASVALAEKISGSETSFAELMTRQAKRWGATNTICKTATGLTAKGQMSTARDLAIIFNEAMNNKEFAARMKLRKTKTQDGTLLRNHNKALWQLKGTLAGKTGYTNAARQTYVGKFKKDADEIIVAILGSESMWGDLKRLVEFGFIKKQYQREIAAKQKQPIAAIFAENISTE